MVVQSLGHVQLYATPWTAQCQGSLSFTIWSFPKCMSIELVMSSNHLLLCLPLLLLPLIFPSIRIFPVSAVLIRWPKYWSFSISAFSEYSGLNSFRIDWCDLPAVQGTLDSFPISQFKSINSSVLCLLYGSALISVHDYWKDHSF